ncbi:hypothetical protein [Deinococcus soli (ex Cha et al. 2016)]|uniref:Uncharacterized protein n=2 Tax=Deinococcus soli (ex Cha et al. 2016) TaxID=1309411 RepID=A0ACC6KHG7_9DEIO|nr:hypothetical protein [Deinococcus soli (ex Cha et al. 2016)]MDR6218832.1 hypothetical protein [Deinococcus soli (ex Cha et al. 2016)]MDR6328629.1 hypothetical protein [Deinococcus soli (ex Cha et al. 2016)]MDR6751884.1 hypothetical protein [Deinococcus soli (ex Cha et al. 2016)]
MNLDPTCTHDYATELLGDGCHWGIQVLRCRRCGGRDTRVSFSEFTCPACLDHPRRPPQALTALRLNGADAATHATLHNLLRALRYTPGLPGVIDGGVHDGLLELTLTFGAAVSRVDVITAGPCGAWAPRPARPARQTSVDALVTRYAREALRHLGHLPSPVTVTLEGPGTAYGHCVPVL